MVIVSIVLACCAQASLVKSLRLDQPVVAAKKRHYWDLTKGCGTHVEARVACDTTDLDEQFRELNGQEDSWSLNSLNINSFAGFYMFVRLQR